MPLPITDPAHAFYSQRVDGQPFVNCYPYSLCGVLRWMGYDVPATYGMELRKASGVPVADHRGTSSADMKRALRKLLPEAPVTFGAVSDGGLINLLPGLYQPNQRNVLAVSFRMERLPRNLRRHCGYSWEGLHSMALHGRKKAPDGSWLVYLADPMGRSWRGYAGEWVSFTDLQPGMKRDANGLINVTYGERGSAQ